MPYIEVNYLYSCEYHSENYCPDDKFCDYASCHYSVDYTDKECPDEEFFQKGFTLKDLDIKDEHFKNLIFIIHDVNDEYIPDILDFIYNNQKLDLRLIINGQGYVENKLVDECKDNEVEITSCIWEFLNQK